MRQIFLLLLLLLPATAFAQTGLGNVKEHPIDRSLNACLEKNLSTQGMNGCLGQAYDAWDKELNRVYNELARKLQPDARAALKTAQLDWLKFRDEEFKLIASVYQAFESLEDFEAAIAQLRHEAQEDATESPATPRKPEKTSR